MENLTTMLVAIMYVTIIVTGVVNLLMFLSEILGRQAEASPLRRQWTWLLLLMHLVFFWNTQLILESSDWSLPGYLCFILGPVVLLFAGNILVAGGDSNGDGEAGAADFLSVKHRFFGGLLLVQFWILGLDVYFASVGAATLLTASAGLLYAILALSERSGVQRAGVIVAWLLQFASIAIQSF